VTSALETHWPAVPPGSNSWRLEYNPATKSATMHTESSGGTVVASGPVVAMTTTREARSSGASTATTRRRCLTANTDVSCVSHGSDMGSACHVRLDECNSSDLSQVSVERAVVMPIIIRLDLKAEVMPKQSDPLDYRTKMSEKRRTKVGWFC
jgi:hypothetical protein